MSRRGVWECRWPLPTHQGGPAALDLTPMAALALQHAVTIPNAPGTIDPGYRGELRVILLNLGREPYTVHAGDRIAQMILARYEAVEWLEGGLADSVRGAGGFGSSGR